MEAGIERYATQERNENPYLKKLADAIRGKVVVLFGAPYTGKTTLAHHLARNYFKKNRYIAIDRNFPADPNIDYIWIRSWTEVVEAIRKAVSEANKDTIIVVDSLTTLKEDFLKDKFDSPRKMNELNRFYELVFRELVPAKEKGATVVVITHEAIKDFQTGQIGPALNIRALKNSDLVLRTSKNGGYKVTVWGKRELVEEPKFYIEGL